MPTNLSKVGVPHSLCLMIIPATESIRKNKLTVAYEAKVKPISTV